MVVDQEHIIDCTMRQCLHYCTVFEWTVHHIRERLLYKKYIFGVLRIEVIPNKKSALSYGV